MFIENHYLSFNSNKPERKCIITMRQLCITAMRQLTKDHPKSVEGEPDKEAVNK